MCLRITAPFLVCTSPLSLLCRGRLLVCSISSLLSSLATLWLMNSLPLSEWKPRMRKGNCRSRAASTGSSQASLMRAVAATICHCVTSSTALMWYTPLPPVDRPAATAALSPTPSQLRQDQAHGGDDWRAAAVRSARPARLSARRHRAPEPNERRRLYVHWMPSAWCTTLISHEIDPTKVLTGQCGNLDLRAVG